MHLQHKKDQVLSYSFVAIGVLSLVILTCGITFLFFPETFSRIFHFLSPEGLNPRIIHLIENVPHLCVIWGGQGIIICCAVFFWLRRHVFSRLWQTRLAVLFTLLIIAVAVGRYFDSATCYSGDGSGHVAEAGIAADCLRNGDSLWWSNQWYCGFPLLKFYGPLHYILAGIVSILCRDICLSVKLLLWVIHLASCLCMFSFIHSLTKSNGAAVVSSLAYGLMPHHFKIIHDSGAHPVAIFYVIFPLLFYVFLKFSQGSFNRSLTVYFLGLLITAALLSHVQYGAIATILFYCSIICVGATKYVRHHLHAREPSNILILLLGVGCFVGGLLLFFWLPFLLQEAKNSLIWNSRGALLSFPTVDRLKQLVNLLRWSYRWQAWELNYVGLSTVILCSVGLIAGLKKRQSRYLTIDAAILGGLFFSLLFILCNRRASNFLGFFLCAGVGLSYAALMHFTSRLGIRIKGYLLPFLCGILFFDMVTALPQIDSRVRSWKSWLEFGIPNRPSELEKLNLPGRYLMLTNDHRTLWNTLETFEHGQDTVFGAAPQNATLSHPFAASLVCRAVKEVYDNEQPLSELVLNGLFLLNVSKIYIPPVSQMNSPYKNGHFMLLDDASPILFAPYGDQWPTDSGLLEQHSWESLGLFFRKRSLPMDYVYAIVKAMDIERSSKTAQHIFLKALPSAGLPPPSQSTNIQPQMKDLNFSQSGDEVRIHVETNQSGYIRLAYSFSPAARAFVDGERTNLYPTVMNFSAIFLKPGKHDVRILYSGDRNDMIRLIFSAFTLLLSTIYVIYDYRKRQKNNKTSK